MITIKDNDEQIDGHSPPFSVIICVILHTADGCHEAMPIFRQTTYANIY